MLQIRNYLHLIVFAFNTAVQSSIGQSPFFIKNLREATLLIDLKLEVNLMKAYPKILLFLQENLSKLDVITLNIKIEMAALNHTKMNEIRRAKESKLEVNDLVLLYKTQPPRIQLHKFRTK